jgi:uncharacterized protein (TIGR02271 family)
MTTITKNQAQSWIGRKAYDSNGDKIGSIETVYLDDATGEPEWFAINTGLFGTHVSFVPVDGATASGDELRLPYDKSFVKDAPRVDADGHLDEGEEETLYRYYGRDRSAGWDRESAIARMRDSAMRTGGDRDTTWNDTMDTRDDRSRRPEGRDTSGRTTDDAMTRSEEELRVDTRQHQTGVARLRKWVETENVNVTVPVKKEKARLVTEPITESNRGKAMSGKDLSSEEHEVVLSEEEIVVDKKVVPKERVRLEKDVTTEDVDVNEQVKKEHIEMEGDTDSGRRNRRT